MYVIVTYQGDPGEEGWNKLTVPAKGSIVLYPDGLLNILDSHGRCWDSRYDVKRAELYATETVEDFRSDAPKPTP